jgi:hypothetical protein
MYLVLMVQAQPEIKRENVQSPEIVRLDATRDRREGIEKCRQERVAG